MKTLAPRLALRAAGPARRREGAAHRAGLPRARRRRHRRGRHAARGRSRPGIAADGARILGGDIEVASQQGPLPQAVRGLGHARAARGCPQVTQMRAMAVAPDGERTLVELKAVDGAYPLFGALVLDPPGAHARPARWWWSASSPTASASRPAPASAWAMPRFTLARRHRRPSPTRSPAPPSSARARMIALADLPRHRPGPARQPGQLRSPHRAAGRRVAPAPSPTTCAPRFPQNGWRIRTADAAAPGVNRFVDRAAFFLTLAGLTALLVGGIGVATGVRAWLDAAGAHHRHAALPRRAAGRDLRDLPDPGAGAGVPGHRHRPRRRAAG